MHPKKDRNPHMKTFILPTVIASIVSLTAVSAAQARDCSSFSNRADFFTSIGLTDAASFWTSVAGECEASNWAEADRSTVRTNIQTLAEASTVVRGAMVQKVDAVDTKGVRLAKLDVVAMSVDDMAAALSGSDALVIATGFVPGNPLKMDAQAHAVDNLGTVALVDAAKKAGVKKVVMVSSILTNGRAWGQENSPGFQVTNAFGHVLDEKIVAEKYLRASGLDYTIVRPGGLKAKPPTGPLKVSKEDTLNAGEVSRDLVADVCVQALSDGKASKKVVEIIEGEGGGTTPIESAFASV